MILAFRLLAKMRGLRGTAFDVFGYSAERRMERALIGEFEAAVGAVLGGLTVDNIDAASKIIGLYTDIRGYGPVKQEALEKVRPQIEQAMIEYTAVINKAA
jgi:indolepyruvate ferredoxin oxidoreductase